MSTLRRDPLSNSWVIFVPDRPFEPDEPLPCRQTVEPGECPYCPGNEHMTLPEIEAFRPVGSLPNSAGWSVRTVPNEHALLHIENKFGRRGEGLYDMMNAVGAHEVIIETPEHDGRLQQFTPLKIEEILRMYRRRMADLTGDTRLRYIQVFRNFRTSAEATVCHPHAQVIGLPVMPRWVGEAVSHAQEYWMVKERCLFCDIIHQDGDGARLIHDNPGVLAIAPFASKMPFEIALYPRDHAHLFHTADDITLSALADSMGVCLRALNRLFPDVAYNFVVHAAPVQPEKRHDTVKARIADYYHWHVQILPRITRVSGYDFGSGFYVNTVLPENAAARYREAIGEMRAQESRPEEKPA